MNDLPWSLRTTTAPLGIAGRVSDAKQIRDAGGIRLHICPATGNAPTRMTRASWERLCAATQRKSLERECIDKNQAQLMRMTRRLNVCAWCRGEILPRGLEFIDAAEMAAMIKPKEEAMAKQSKLGVCENCGDKGVLTASFGRRVCTTCLKIRSGVNSHIERVAAAARDMGRAPELLAALVPEGGGLAIKVTADLLQEISGLVGYDGEDPGELVEAVRKRALACASCDAEDVLHEIREIVGYVPEQGDKGLADMVRQLVALPSVYCGKCTTLRGDLLRACGLEMDDTEDGEGWDVAAAAAIQEIARLEYHRDFWASKATLFKIEAGDLRSELLVKRGEIEELRNVVSRLGNDLTIIGVQTNSDPDEMTAIRDELERTSGVVDVLREAGKQLRDRLQTSESRLIWYREAMQVLRDRLGLDHLGEDEDVVERMLEAIASQAQALTRFQDLARSADVRADEVEAELAQARSEINGLRDAVHGGQSGPASLLDIALAALRGDALRGEAVAGLIEAARRAA